MGELAKYWFGVAFGYESAADELRTLLGWDGRGIARDRFQNERIPFDAYALSSEGSG